MSEITDETPLRLSGLAEYLHMSRDLIYADKTKGYVFEFPVHRLTTARHYKAWMRSLKKEEPAVKTPEDQERLQRELRRQRLIVGKSHAQPLTRDSRKPSPPRAKSSGSKQPA